MNKESIVQYIDRRNKGYISLCDLCRVIKDVLLWYCFIVGFLLLISIPGILMTKPEQLFTMVGLINIVIGWILLIIYWVLIALGFHILNYIWNKITPYYNKCKIKLCKIKLIKLR